MRRYIIILSVFNYLSDTNKMKQPFQAFCHQTFSSNKSNSLLTKQGAF